MYILLHLDFLDFSAKIYRKRKLFFLTMLPRSLKWFQLYSLKLANDFENQLELDKMEVTERIADSLFVL